MLVNHERRLIYMHNPRTGGTALTHWLRGCCGFDYVHDPKELVDKTEVGCELAWGHSWVMPPHLKQLVLDAISSENPYRFFTTVRHPVTRFLSWWRYLNAYGLLPDGVRTLEEYVNARRVLFQSCYLARQYITPDTTPVHHQHETMIVHQENLAEEIQSLIPEYHAKLDRLNHLHNRVPPTQAILESSVSPNMLRQINEIHAYDYLNLPEYQPL